MTSGHDGTPARLAPGSRASPGPRGLRRSHGGRLRAGGELADIHEASTVKIRYRGLFRFCGWLVDKDELPEHPMKTLSPPQPKAKPVPALTDDELAALMKACAGKDFRHPRDESVLRLLHDCGIRVSELCTLTVESIDLDQGMGLVRGKGNKVRPVCFGARTARVFDRYLRMRARHRWSHLDAQAGRHHAAERHAFIWSTIGTDYGVRTRSRAASSRCPPRHPGFRTA